MDNTITLNPPERRFQKGDLIQFPDDYSDGYTIFSHLMSEDGTFQSDAEPTQVKAGSEHAGKLAVVAGVGGSPYTPYSLVFEDGNEVSWFSGQGLTLVAEDRWHVAGEWKETRDQKVAAYQATMADIDVEEQDGVGDEWTVQKIDPITFLTGRIGPVIPINFDPDMKRGKFWNRFGQSHDGTQIFTHDGLAQVLQPLLYEGVTLSPVRLAWKYEDGRIRERFKVWAEIPGARTASAPGMEK